MNVKSAGAFFFVSSGISLVIFLALTGDSLKKLPSRTHEEALSPQVTAGKWTWQKYNCNDCHTILGIGGYYAPDLTKVRDSRDPEWLARFIKDPHGVWPAPRRMPTLGLSDREVTDVVAFLNWVGGIDTNAWPPKPQMAAPISAGGGAAPPGEAIFRTEGCSACHALNGSGGHVGPDLSRVGARRDRAWIEDQLRDPKSHKASSIMPSFARLPRKSLDELADYLAGLK